MSEHELRIIRKQCAIFKIFRNIPPEWNLKGFRKMYEKEARLYLEKQRLSDEHKKEVYNEIMNEYKRRVH